MLKKHLVLFMNRIMPLRYLTPNLMRFLILAQIRPHLFTFLLNDSRIDAHPIPADHNFLILDQLVELDNKIEGDFGVANYADIGELKGIIVELREFFLGVEAGRTIPAVGHLHAQEDMALVLAPFYHWLAGALTQHDLFLHQLQSLQFFLQDARKKMLVLAVVEVQDGSGQANVAFFETSSEAAGDILLLIQDFSSIDYLSLLAFQGKTSLSLQRHHHHTQQKHFEASAYLHFHRNHRLVFQRVKRQLQFQSIIQSQHIILQQSSLFPQQSQHKLYSY